MSSRDSINFVGKGFLAKTRELWFFTIFIPEEAERAWRAIGRVAYGATEQEKASLQYRRSLYIVKDMKAGETLTRNNLKAIRQGLGLPTKYFDVLIGKPLNQDVSKGTPVSWDIV